MDRYCHLRNVHGFNTGMRESRIVNNVRIRRPGPQGEGLADINPHSSSRSSLLSSTIGWPEGRTPLCAEGPNHGVYMGIDPVAIQSFLLSAREDRSNSAQSALPPITHSSTLILTEVLTQGFPPPWAQGLVSYQRCTPDTLVMVDGVCRRCTRGGVLGRVYRRGIPTRVYRREAYPPGCTREAYPGIYTTLCTPGYIPPYVHPGIYHPMYTR